MTAFIFPAKLEWHDEDRIFLVTFPDVPEAVTSGGDRREALVNAEDALEEAIAAYVNLERELPKPSSNPGESGFVPVAMGPLMTAKAALYEAWRRSGLSKVAFAERLGIAEGEVRRMLNPRHATKIERIDAALRALGRRLMVSVADLRGAEVA